MSAYVRNTPKLREEHARARECTCLLISLIDRPEFVTHPSLSLFLYFSPFRFVVFIALYEFPRCEAALLQPREFLLAKLSDRCVPWRSRRTMYTLSKVWNTGKFIRISRRWLRRRQGTWGILFYFYCSFFLRSFLMPYRIRSIFVSPFLVSRSRLSRIYK